ncbi:MAG TPA: hypothetical protein VLH60_02650 [Sedimentisphaerales bacterium]|nr:hypothetical protein [Sedimentisphaerales bacterium]
MNKFIPILFVMLVVAGSAFCNGSAARSQFVLAPDITAAQDDSGDFTTIMDAM